MCVYRALHKCVWVTLYGFRKIRFRTKKTSQTVLWFLHSVFCEHASKMDTSKEKVCNFLEFSFNKGDRVSQATDIVNSVMVLIMLQPITRNFGLVDSISVNLISKKHDALELSKIMGIVRPSDYVSTASLAQQLNIPQNHSELLI